MKEGLELLGVILFWGSVVIGILIVIARKIDQENDKT